MTVSTDTIQGPRYGRVAIALHWLLGLALLAEIVFGFLLDDIAPRGTPARAGVINLHKSIGVVLGLLALARLAWWLKHRPPPWPASMPRWEQRAATLGHQALYTGMIVVPLAGYVASNFSKYGVKFFGIALRPWGPDLPALYTFLGTLHTVTSWLFCALIAVHVAAALKHAFVNRDGIFSSIWSSASS